MKQRIASVVIIVLLVLTLLTYVRVSNDQHNACTARNDQNAVILRFLHHEITVPPNADAYERKAITKFLTDADAAFKARACPGGRLL